MQTIAVDVVTLPDTLQAALRSVGYGKKSVGIRASETASLATGAGAGQRGFAIVCNLATGERRETIGSWGGANVFESRPVDCDSGTRPMPENGAIVCGVMGSYVWAQIDIHPALFAPLLPPVADVTDREARILGCFSYKSAYRARYLEDLAATPAEVDALVSRAFLTRNKAGATALTTAGKNAAKGMY